MSLLLDAGGLIALERGDRRLWSTLTGLEREGVLAAAPGVVVAQVWRGGSSQARLSRALRLVDELPLSTSACRSAGELCGRAGTADVVDALVVVLADRLGRDIVTGDPDDIGRLVAAASSRSRVLAL